MKAEHRKELQTNTLADFLGRSVLKVRTGSGIPWFKLFLIVFVVAGVFLVWWYFNSKKRTSAENWAKVDFNDQSSLLQLYNEAKESKQGQAAQFTLYFGMLWDGINSLGNKEMNPFGALQGIDEASKFFKALAEECKEDPMHCAEAKYHLATAYESLAVFKIDYLEDSKRVLEELSTEPLAATAYGKLAKRRLDLHNNVAERMQIMAFYLEFQTMSKFGKIGQ